MRSLFTLLLIALLSSCSTLPEMLDHTPTIVVEGSIEQGEVATVYLSQLLPTSSSDEMYAISEVPIIWAKVTLSDGETSEVLTGSFDNTHILGFKYRTLHMRGEVGQQYDLTVEYSGVTVTATTTILDEVAIDPIEVEVIDDSLCTLRTTIHDPAESDNYYVVLACEQGQEQNPHVTILGMWNDEKLAEQSGEINIYRPFSMTYGADIEVYFHLDSLVTVKVAHVDQASYEFWTTFQDHCINSGNLIYPSEQNPSSNINGGLGIWWGMSTQTESLTPRTKVLTAEP
ncbi:MAG: DUF4249 family protein [Rikenellaceae bacterium]